MFNFSLNTKRKIGSQLYLNESLICFPNRLTSRPENEKN